MTTLVTSPANAAVKAARRLARPGSSGRSSGAGGPRSVLVEGPEPIREALGHVRRLFATPAALERHADLAAEVADRGASVLAVSDAVLATIATTVTPQGLCAVADLPTSTLEAALDAALAGDGLAGGGLVVVCDRVADPGNAGTVIRTADAAGADVVVLTAGSVAATNPKVVRSSAGSLFHLPVVEGAPLLEVLGACRARGLRTVGTAASAPTAHTDVDLAGPVAVVLGAEAAGLPAAGLDACDLVVSVPIADVRRPGFSGRAESLNLAATAAVVMYEAARQRREALRFAPDVQRKAGR